STSRALASMSPLFPYTTLFRSHVHAIEPGKVHLPDETIEADTIVLAAGILPSPVVAGLPVEKDKRGHIVVDGAMRCPSRPEVWRSEEHTSELQSRFDLVCRLLL